MKNSYPIPIGRKLLLLCLLICSTSVFAQRKVSGKVLDGETSLPLPGTTVQIKGVNKGTSTNSEGVYSLDIPNGSTLVFSSIGFLSQEIIVGNQTTINITLSPDSKALSEVVVTGYS